MEVLAGEHGFKLPPFTGWTPEQWQEKGHEYDEIRGNKLGWDITDFGLNQFEKTGFSLITIRNGSVDPKGEFGKPYAEKLIMLRPGQGAPMHYHWSKMEDIINRGGNDLYIKVYNGDKDRNRLDTDVAVRTDGQTRMVPAGTMVLLKPGESITLPPYLYHEFITPETGGPVLVGEVSMCNDDENDNCFYDAVGRFPSILEDEPPYRLLCNEYPPAN